jgi:hypothetical protein
MVETYRGEKYVFFFFVWKLVGITMQGIRQLSNKFGMIDPWKSMQGNLSRCHRVLKQWVRKEVGNINEKIQAKTRELEQEQCREEGRSEEHEKTLKEEINILLEQEYDRWRQRAKEKWLKNGDKNTKYFHACVNQRRWSNQILQIQNEKGQL